MALRHCSDDGDNITTGTIIARSGSPVKSQYAPKMHQNSRPGLGVLQAGRGAVMGRIRARADHEIRGKLDVRRRLDTAVVAPQQSARRLGADLLEGLRDGGERGARG